MALKNIYFEEYLEPIPDKYRVFFNLGKINGLAERLKIEKNSKLLDEIKICVMQIYTYLSTKEEEK